MNKNRRVKVGAESSLSDGAGTIVTVEEVTLAIFRIEGRCYAIANACPHRGGPLGKGEVAGFVVTCPWHGWAWDVRTGVNVRQPHSRVSCFPVVVENGEVFVELSAQQENSTGE